MRRQGERAARAFTDAVQPLAHPYTICGTVVHGQHLGRTVGMPTANLDADISALALPCGVYATLTRLGGALYPGVTNVGRRPSVDSSPIITVETHLLDFSRDIYGETLHTEVRGYIRPVHKFAGLAEVQAQVQKDIARAREFFVRFAAELASQIRDA
ncbi:riboflavin kinase [Treponema endosymbiont of Eucomonympha sp.]|uniref:riboflavin kinase n=1 Tax=Treponema endosymbiont of Eucomonympha sp. TaxID=1580831 RepID=UPI0007824DF3|nr:riboflavin kinase [Treponema endosymbiont of Eucomonympha sp.]